MGRYLLERKAVSWSRLGARYCVRLEMRYLILFVQRIVNKNNLSLLRRIWSQCKYSDHCHLSLVTPSHKSELQSMMPGPLGALRAELFICAKN